MPFQPRICACSYSEYRHVVKSEAEWQRHQAKARSDHVGSALGENNPPVSTTAGPQRTRKRSLSSGEEDSVEENTQPLVRRAKRELPDPYAARPQPLRPQALRPQLSKKTTRQLDHDASDDEEYLQTSELQGTVESGAEPGSTERDTEEEPNFCRLAQSENFLPPGYGLEDDYDPGEEFNDAEDSDEEMFDLFLGAMRRGYEEEESEEEESEDEESDEEEERPGNCESGDRTEADVQTGPERAARSMGDSQRDGGDQLFHSEQSTFDYQDPFGDPLTAKEVLSMSMHGIHRQFKTQRRCVNKIRDVMGRMLGVENKPHDDRTVNKRIKQRTGVNEIKYDCCPKSHMSYAMYPEDTECRVCQHPRWKTITNLRSKKGTERRVPHAQHIYIPLAHRIRLWWSNSKRAQKMIHYRTMAVQGGENGKLSDFWTGTLIKDLKKTDEQRGERVPMFSQDTDLAFFLSTDGVKVFKSRRAFHIWPLLLINLNLPPEERVKRCNMILMGFIPGPQEPKDLDSFLFPLVQEFLTLGKGLPDGFNAARRDTVEQTFLLRAYIVCIGADMVGRAKV
jgi:hypothetical protein